MDPAPIDVCMVDDDSDQRMILERRLRQAGFRCALAANGEEALGIIQLTQPKVLITDWMMPGIDGLELCRRLRSAQATQGLYIIVLTARHDRESLTVALETGADDFLTKPCDIRELIVRVKVGMRFWSLQDELKRSAITDGLTGLYNHQFFTQILEREFARCSRYSKPMAVMMLDLDHFKAVNDTFGHEVGNAVLRRAAELLTNAVRNVDTIARYGGEEFALVAPEAQRADAFELAERLRLKLATHLTIGQAPNCTTTVSIGVATNDDPRATSAQALLDLADKAMYLAKRSGRNRVCIADHQRPSQPPQSGPQVEQLDELRKEIAALELRAKNTYVESIAVLVQTLEARDPFTARHSQNVTFYAEELARELGLTPALITAVRHGAMLHDIGKIAVPDRILLKPGKLDDEERAVLRRVPETGARILSGIRMLEMELPIIRHQHEFYDGTGFPSGLRGEEIPFGARILHVADAFDALTSHRAYRDCFSVEDAVEVLRKSAGQQFDPRVVRALESAMGRRRDLWMHQIESARLQLDEVAQGQGRPEPEAAVIAKP
jgi:diguanylate cyclase (GGDEF)-like protein/putative nucleotidyltransferase with HDIG domain